MRRFHLPHPATLFFGLTLLLLLLTWMAEAYGLQTLHPVTHEPVAVRSVLNGEGMRWLLRHGVSNLYHYSTLGQVLLGLLSLGLSYHSGFIHALLNTSCLRRITPRGMVALVILLGAASHLLGDVGYLLLLPLSATLFRAVGLSPAAGLLTAWMAIGCTALHYALFLSLSGLLILPLLYGLSCRHLLPRTSRCPLQSSLAPTEPTATDEVPAANAAAASPLTRRERRALTTALTAGALYVGLLLWGCYALSDLFLGVDGTLLHSPLMEGIVPLACLGAAWMGGVYGAVSGRYRSDAQLIAGAVSLIPLLCDYFLLLLGCVALNALFAYSQLGPYLLIEASQWVSTLTLPTPLMLLLFILLTALLNLLVVTPELKWSLLSPCLLPLFSTLHISPEAAYSAFSIGDCSTTTLSPFQLYLPFVLALLRHEEPQAGYSTLLAHSWRYSLLLLCSWSLLYLLWSALGLPFSL